MDFIFFVMMVLFAGGSINLLHTNRVSYPQAFGLANCHGLTPIIQHAIFLSCKTVIVWVPVRALGRQDVVRDIHIIVLLESRFREFKIADDPPLVAAG